MDDDPALRSLADELERDDPALAALLAGRPERPHHRLALAWLLVGPALLVPAFLLPARVVLGAAAMLLILASPWFACWLGTVSDRPAAGHP